MSTKLKFGRKINIPPTTVIKHQLCMMAATDSLVGSLKGEGQSPETLAAKVTNLVKEYGISADRANMLMDRMGVERGFLGMNEGLKPQA